MATQDVTTEHGNELLGLRDTQFAAQPTQALDSTTILTAEVKRVRNLDVVTTPMDSNTKLEINWDGVR